MGARRPDPNDRRANRLYLTPAARPLLKQLSELGEDMMATVLDKIDEPARAHLLRDLDTIKDSLRAAIARNGNGAHGGNGQQQEGLRQVLMLPRPCDRVIHGGE